MSILGSRVLRTEDPTFLTAGGTYAEDLKDPLLEGAGHITFVRSTMAHADISVDISEAVNAPGVLAVLTASDIVLAPRAPAMPLYNPGMTRQWLAAHTVRHVGEPIAIVVTERRDQGADAAELVVVDYTPKVAVIGVEAANAAGAPLLHEDAGSNVVIDLSEPLPAGFFDGCDVVVSQRIVNQRLAACPLEVRGSAAAIDDRDRVVLWCSTQAPHGVRDSVCQSFDWPQEAVRVVAPDVGGGFGAKIGAYTEDLLVAWAARHLGRAVRWTETRSENMQAMGHGRAQVQTVTIGGRADGTVVAYRLDVLQDAGAYPLMGAILPWLTKMMAPGTYDIERVSVSTVSLVTSTMSTVAYRGAGRPEATAALERAMDIFASEIGMDAVEVRRRNLIAPDAFPFTTKVGTTYDSGDYAGALDMVLEAVGYADLRAEQARRRAAGDPVALGIGVSTYVEVTAGPTAGKEHATVEITADGGAIVRTGTSPHGQGHVTSWKMLASDRLGLPMDKIEIRHGDTDEVASGEGTMGSRSLQVGGSAVVQAAELVVDLARRVAADALEANPADVVLDAGLGVFHVVGTPAVSRSWADVARAASSAGTDLVAATDFHAPSPTFPFGAHVVVVEVDTETGKVVVKRVVTCDDAGTLLNPLLAEGQRHGGIAQGVAQALCEEMAYDDDGNPMTGNFADYGIISACELPSFELVTMETPTPHNPLGAKGIGESGTIGSTPAVQSAVCDALAHVGVRHVDMPATPERVWLAIQEARI